MELVEKTRRKLIFHSIMKPVFLNLDDIGYIYSILDHEGEIYYNDHKIVDINNINERLTNEKFKSLSVENDYVLVDINKNAIVVAGRRKYEREINEVVKLLTSKQRNKRISENLYFYSLSVSALITAVFLTLGVHDKLIRFSMATSLLLLTTFLATSIKKFFNSVILRKKSQINFFLKNYKKLSWIIFNVIIAGILNQTGFFKSIIEFTKVFVGGLTR
jgi:hypothetical protein